MHGKHMSVDTAVILKVSQHISNVSEAAGSCLTCLPLILLFAVHLKIGKGESS